MIKRLIVYALSFLLIGCGSFQTSAPSKYKRGPSFYISNEWLQRNEKKIVEEAVARLREKHPSTSETFPYINISSLDSADDGARLKIPRESEILLLDIIQNVVDQLVTKDGRAVMNLDISVRGNTSEPSDVYLAALMVYGIACIGTSLALVCPLTGKEVVVVDGALSGPNGEKTSFTGVGASRGYALSPYAGDSPDIGSDAIAKALLAALVKLADQIISQQSG